MEIKEHINTLKGLTRNMPSPYRERMQEALHALNAAVVEMLDRGLHFGEPAADGLYLVLIEGVNGKREPRVCHWNGALKQWEMPGSGIAYWRADTGKPTPTWRQLPTMIPVQQKGLFDE